MKKILILAFIFSLAAVSPGRKKSIAVLDLVSEGVDRSAASLLSEKLRNEILSTGKYTVVERSQMNEILKEQGFQQTGCTSSECAVKVGQLIGVTHMIAGTIGKLNRTYYISIRLFDVSTGKIIASADDAESSSLEYALSITMAKLTREIIRQDLEGPAGRTGESRFITVSTPEEFLRAIQSNKVIMMRPGTYNLSDKTLTSNRYIQWKNEYDGYFPVIKSVENIKIIGKGNVEVLINPAYGWVLEFQTSKNIVLENITFGHTKPGYCLGGVLKFSTTESVEINRCVLYGSGTYGIELSRVYNFVLNNSTVKECTYGLLQIEGTTNASFLNSKFLNTKEFDLVSVRDSSKIYFSRCRFEGNSGSILFSITPTSKNVGITGCDIRNNSTKKFISNIENAVISKSRFSGNSFRDYGDSRLNEMN